MPAGETEGCGKAWGSREDPRKASRETRGPTKVEKDLEVQGGS